MKDFLTSEEILALRSAHKQIKEKKLADRIKAILSLNAGFSYDQIEAILLLDEVTLRRYVEKLKTHGVNGLLEFRYHGGASRLSLTQEEEIKKYLR